MSRPENLASQFPKTRAPFFVHALMLVATVLVATSFPVVATITGSLDSAVLTFIRFSLATLLFGPIVAVRYGIPCPGLRDLLRYSVLSLLLVSFFWCMFAALRLTTPLNTAAIFSLSPVITAAIAAVLLREKMMFSARVALPLGAIGAIWVIFRGDVDALMALRLGAGDLLFLAGTIALATYGTLVKVLHRGEPAARMTFWILATGSVWLSFLALPGLRSVAWAEIPIATYAGIAYLSVFSTIVTFFLFQWSTTRIGPTRVMSYTFLNPALVLIIGLVFADSLPPFATWPGVILAIAATVVLQTNFSVRARPVTPGPRPALES